MVDERWNLAWSTAEQAWQRLPKNPDGTIDWGNVRVAHLDTGFTRHEAFGPWSSNRTSKTILTRLGKDYFKRNRPDATDPLKSGFFLFPGHGTRSGSALSGLDTAAGFTGIAPRLPLIPCRVTDSVIIDSGAAKAVGDAINETVAKNRAKIVSISLGNIFGYKAMGQAVDRAYDKGVLVIAAAGQKVDKVTYPGRHRRVVAVAGVTKRGKREYIYNKYDSYARIDTWAPAKPIRRGNYKPNDRYGSGDGTTYATLHVVAAAAMWLRLHGAQIQQLYGNTWQRIEAFRQLLSASQRALAFKVPQTNRAGGLDIDALLSLPLPDPATLQKEMDLAADDLF
jgi:subtilisin family serine protease